MDTKQKVAVSVPSLSKELMKRAGLPFFAGDVYKDRKAGQGAFYGEMIKLKNGLVFMNGEIIDVREQVILFDFCNSGQNILLLKIIFLSIVQILQLMFLKILQKKKKKKKMNRIYFNLK